MSYLDNFLRLSFKTTSFYSKFYKRKLKIRFASLFKPSYSSKFMESYEESLKQAYSKLIMVSNCSERFEIPKVEGQIEGKNTIIVNIAAIASYLRRPIEHLAKFLQKELAVSGKLENNRLILNTKLNSQKVNEKINLYAKHFVICSECCKPDTEIVLKKGIRFKHCLACGAKSPIKYSV